MLFWKENSFNTHANFFFDIWAISAWSFAFYNILRSEKKKLLTNEAHIHHGTCISLVLICTNLKFHQPDLPVKQISTIEKNIYWHFKNAKLITLSTLLYLKRLNTNKNNFAVKIQNKFVDIRKKCRCKAISWVCTFLKREWPKTSMQWSFFENHRFSSLSKFNSTVCQVMLCTMCISMPLDQFLYNYAVDLMLRSSSTTDSTSLIHPPPQILNHILQHIGML